MVATRRGNLLSPVDEDRDMNQNAVTIVSALAVVVAVWTFMSVEHSAIRNDIGDDIDSVETRLETRLDSMQQELSAIQSELSSIAQRISYIEGHLSIERSTPEIENSPAP